MWGGYNPRMQREYQSDVWIQRNVPGGLNGPLGRQLDNYFGGNPNPTFGQMRGQYPQAHAYGNPYGYHHRRW